MSASCGIVTGLDVRRGPCGQLDTPYLGVVCYISHSLPPHSPSQTTHTGLVTEVVIFTVLLIDYINDIVTKPEVSS